MTSSWQPLLANIGALGILGLALFLITHRDVISTSLVAINQPAEIQLAHTASVTNVAGTPNVQEDEPKKEAGVIPDAVEPPVPPAVSAEGQGTEIARIRYPYISPPYDADTLNTEARAALVNILCEASSNSVKSISGSGTIIDPRGIIATNAHVAQYILLAKNSNIAISCRIRTGSPAQDAWDAEILFFPALWVDAHAKDIVNTRPTGTGEHDFALLRIIPLANEVSLPTTFPYLEPDAREAIGFAGDPILIAAYPAEFGGSSAALNNLNVSTVFSNIKQMLTFGDISVDMISLGGTAVAQSGSSGGAVLNMWGRAIGIIATTSEGDTTEKRDLRAITYAHIDRSIRTHTGKGLEDLLQQDPALQAVAFKTEARKLAHALVLEIEKNQH